MKCPEAQDLLYLYRPGELTREERRDLEAHLTSCATCAAEQKALANVEKKISDIRNTEPQLNNPAHLVDAIMRATVTAGHLAGNPFENLLSWTTAPAFHLAACIALFMLCGTFFLQTAMDARSIVTLEERLKSERTAPSAMRANELQRAGLPFPATDRISLPAALRGDAGTHLRRWRQEPTLEAILMVLLGRQASPETTVIDYLAKRHPRLASVRIDDGIDDHEREILASDGEALIIELESLMLKGGIHNERQ